MTKLTISLAAAFLMTTSSFSLAQSASDAGSAPQSLTEAVSKALIDRRLDIVKVALGLTAEQQKFWPAVEDAIRSRMTARHMRIANVAAQLDKSTEVSPIELMRNRADALSQRATSLGKLADAWQPLYASLDSNQRQRLKFLGVYVLHEMRDAAEARLMEADDDDEDYDN